MSRIMGPGMPADTPFLEAPPAPGLGAVPPGVEGCQGSALADLLRASAPGRAYGFRLDMHERACERGGDHWCDLWRSTVESLRAMGNNNTPRKQPAPQTVRERP